MTQECFIVTFGSGTKWHWETYSPSPQGNRAVTDASCCAQAFRDGCVCEGFSSSTDSQNDGQKWLDRQFRVQLQAS
jgi:hypothetical protein